MIMPCKLILYKSERYIVSGDLNKRIVITDTYEDESYVLTHSSLSNFGKKLINLREENLNSLIMDTILYTNKSNPKLKKTA